MLNGESYLKIKEGVNISPRGDFLIKADKDSGIIQGYYKKIKIQDVPSQIYSKSSNDADHLAMYSHIFDQVSGHVLLLGLGIGGVAALIADIPEVEKLTIGEYNLGAINLFVKGNYPNANKINIINDRSYNINRSYDYIVWDDGIPHPKKPIMAKSKNPTLYPDWNGYNTERGGHIDISNRPWPRMFELDDPRLISVKTRIESLNTKIL
jgi:hypothetical protein